MIGIMNASWIGSHMATIDRERYVQYLQALERLLRDWKNYRKTIPAQRMAKEREQCHLACYMMFHAIQTAIDLAHLVISEMGYRRPNTNRECFAILKNENFLRDAKVSRKLEELASFRNILAHQYPALNVKKAHRNLMTGHSALLSFQKIVARHVIGPKRYR